MAVATEFTIIKGKALDFIIIVKKNGSLLPLELSGGDTFTYSLVEKKTGALALENVSMTVTDALAGEVTGTISAIASATLVIKKGSSEDGYIPRPNYRLVVNGSTTSQGDMTAIIEDVYVVVG